MDESKVKFDEYLVAPLSVKATRETVATKTYYFVNNKNWSNVYSYSWKYDSDSDSTVETQGAFPGVPAKKVGTTTKYDGQKYDVYAVEIPVNDNFFVLSEGTDHGQQSDDIRVRYYYGANMIRLNVDNLTQFDFCNPETDIIFE